jgi:hypothetical protein
MPASDTAEGTWVDRNGGFAGHGDPATTTTLTVDGTAYAITCDPTMAALKAIRELTGHARPNRLCHTCAPPMALARDTSGEGAADERSVSTLAGRRS